MSEPYEPKLVMLPGAPPSVEVILHRTLAKLDHIKGVTVVIQWKADESFSVDWSTMSKSELYMAARVLDLTAVAETKPSDGS